MSVPASVNYHIKSDAPQAFRFDVDGIAGNLVSPELLTHAISVQDIRDGQFQPDFETDGIRFVDEPSQVESFDSSTSWQTVYDDELERLLKDQIGAAEVIVFDHTVRIDDPDAVRRPARNVHNDYNRAGAEQRLIDIIGAERSTDFHQSGFGFVNVWRPIGAVIESSPLGFIRPQSMVPTDWMDIGLIYPDRFGQILGVAANTAHEWFFRSRMTPDEAVIFNIYDSKGRPHLAHSALDLPGDENAARPRQSIESRTLVRYN
ncbi:MAG: hypothetical protein HRU11_01600 [Parvularculaceae bacterium]|nr:hypothetical protein [Parvularculaceae bacterium]